MGNNPCSEVESSYGTREVAMHKNNRVEYSKDFWNIFFNKFLLFVGAAIFYLILSFLSGDKYKNLFLIYFRKSPLQKVRYKI